MSHLTIVKDPLRTVHNALERHGSDPRGPEHKFTARCPAHEDRDPSLSVSVGADGRALVWCHAGCEAEAVVDALGLTWADLFPTGHRHARPLRGIGKPIRPLDLVLQTLLEVHISYRCTRNERMWVADRCPVCRRSDRWPLFIVEDERGRVTLSCAGGCEQTDVLAELVGAES
jgi:hypothetical protein